MINVYNEEYSALLTEVADKVLTRFDMQPADVEVEIDFLDDAEMTSLNKEARGVDSLTDVLSFPSLEVEFPFIKDNYPDDINPETDAVMLGEIYISLTRAAEQAKDLGHSLSEEVAFLTCHGMLHLLGFDHIEAGDAEEMESLQREILNRKSYDDKQCEGGHRFGHIAVIGRPNAGKSTFVNAAVGEKVSIVSWKPQTTRNGIMGIYTAKGAQIVFIDTPGLHAPKNKLGKFMMRNVTSALDDADAVLYVVDAEKGLFDEDIENIRRYIAMPIKTVVCVNKVDRVTKEKVAFIFTELAKIEGIETIIPMSALRGKNVKLVLEELTKLLPEGESVYPVDEYTLSDMKFMTSEIIREKALRLLGDEIPYGVGVNVNKYEYRPSGSIIDIDADVVVEKANHKGIVLGKGGSMIKKIATYARQDLEDITGTKIFITLWVRVKEEWRDNQAVLNDLGYVKKKITE